MEELSLRYGVVIQNLPPYRPDRKGLVEKAFDLIQGRYKPLLRGKGVIEEDAAGAMGSGLSDAGIFDAG